jgi:hypothetical protein
MKYYYYRTYESENPNDDYIMNITPNGVSLEFRDGRVLLTKFVPKKIFSKQNKLSPKDIRSIHLFLKYKNFEGKMFNKKPFDKIKRDYYKKSVNDL